MAGPPNIGPGGKPKPAAPTTGYASIKNQDHGRPPKGAARRPDTGTGDRHGASSSGLSYERKGAASKPKSAPKLVKISWEDGTESHVTPQHAKDIRDQADRLRQSSRGFGRKDATNTP